MKYKYQYEVYRTGSSSGYVGIEAPDKYTRKKFNYVKIIKDGDTYYLDKNGELVKKAFATNFAYYTAHNIVMLMQSDSTYKNCNITRYETNFGLNARTTLCRKIPDKFLKKNTATICHCPEVVTDESPKHKQIPTPNVCVGMAVVHKTFGDGKIVKIEDNMRYIKIAFSNCEKEFLFPSCFEREFLKAK